MKKMTRQAIVLSAVLLLCAAGAAAQEGVEDKCLQLVLSSVENPTPADRTGDRNSTGAEGMFSAQRTTDLFFNVLFPPTTTGKGVLTLRVSTPRGHHYRQLDVPYSFDRGEGGSGTRRVTGYPYPMQVVTASDIEFERGSYKVIQVAFPVGGTSIVSSSLYGKWVVEGAVSGDLDQCISATVFLITQ